MSIYFYRTNMDINKKKVDYIEHGAAMCGLRCESV